MHPRVTEVYRIITTAFKPIHDLYTCPPVDKKSHGISSHGMNFFLCKPDGIFDCLLYVLPFKGRI